MNIRRDQEIYNMLLLALFPAGTAGAAVLLAQRLRGGPLDWVLAGIAAGLLYCATLSVALLDVLATANRQHRAERARAAAVQAAYQVFTNSEARLPYTGRNNMPGMRRKTVRMRANGQERVLVYYEAMDPAEQERRDSLTQTVLWAWAAENDPERSGKSGLTVEALVGPGKAFAHTSEWGLALQDLADIGVVQKANGTATTWAISWGPDKALAYLQSGVPLPLDYKRRPARVKVWDASRPPRPTPPATPAAEGPAPDKV